MKPHRSHLDRNRRSRRRRRGGNIPTPICEGRKEPFGDLPVRKFQRFKYFAHNVRFTPIRASSPSDTTATERDADSAAELRHSEIMDLVTREPISANCGAAGAATTVVRRRGPVPAQERHDRRLLSELRPALPAPDPDPSLHARHVPLPLGAFAPRKPAAGRYHKSN